VATHHPSKSHVDWHTSIAATAASRHINDMSAPVQPSVRKASSLRLTSEPHGILRR